MPAVGSRLLQERDKPPARAVTASQHHADHTAEVVRSHTKTAEA
jgi:hypothetical protein